MSSTSVVSSSTSSNDSDDTSNTTTIILIVCAVSAVVLLAIAGAIYCFTRANGNEKMSPNVEMARIDRAGVAAREWNQHVQHQQVPNLAYNATQADAVPELPSVQPSEGSRGCC